MKKNHILLIGGVLLAGAIGYLFLHKKGNNYTIGGSNTTPIKYSDGFLLQNGVLKDGYGNEIDTEVRSYDPVKKIVTYNSGQTQDLTQFF